MDDTSSGTESMSLISRFKRASAGFETSIQTNEQPPVANLDALARELGRSPDARAEIGTRPALWTDLRKLWRDLARAQLSFWDGDDSEGEGDHGSEKNRQRRLQDMSASLAKFTRNLVAGTPENQLKAFECEPDMRLLLHYHTSWSAMEDKDSIALARFLTQAISNMVTSNEMLLAKIWETYMSVPEDQAILIRLLGSPDEPTLLTALIFIVNCVHGNRHRTKLLCKTPIGYRVCISLLDNMLRLYDAEQPSDGAQAFDMGYEIFTRIIQEGFIPDLYAKFSLSDEVITPHQTTTLKLVDSYLQAVQLNAPMATTATINTHTNLSPMLAKTFFSLSTYAQRAIRDFIGSPPSPHSRSSSPRSASSASAHPYSPRGVNRAAKSSNSTTSGGGALDAMLPKVCEALVLVTQCVVTIVLEAEEQRSFNDLQSDPGSAESNHDMKDYFNEAMLSPNEGIAESLIELLRLLNLFLPRINFGKPVIPTGSDGTSSSVPAEVADSAGFSYLKRDLVRLLGVLCYGTKAVQDRVRECGGIEEVLNLCVIDERNPYLREHAIFTLHNLLKDNPENQAVVDAVKPDAEWDKDGFLRNASRSR